MKWILPMLLGAAAVAADAPLATKPLPMPLSPKQAEGVGTVDPTQAATRAMFTGSAPAGAAAPAPFQRFEIRDPLNGQQPFPMRTPVADVESPVVTETGKPAPVLR